MMPFRFSIAYGSPFVAMGLLFAMLVCCFQNVDGQPTVQQFQWDETCRNKDNEIKEALDFILLEVKRQKHENQQLRSELEQLKQKSAEHRFILLQLSDSVSLLVHKLLNSSSYCNCQRQGDVANVREEDGAERPQADSENKIIVNKKKQKNDFNTMTYQSVSPVTSTLATTTTVDPLLQMYNGFVPHDCDDLLRFGYNHNGTYQIRPNNTRENFPVLCEFSDHKAWTLIQKRVNGFVDFYRTWDEYKDGFGDLAGEFWLGNEKIYLITNQASYKLGIDMWDWRDPNNPQDVSRHYFSESAFFRIDNESMFYKLNVPEDYYEYKGFGGSGLRVHAGTFVTWDKMQPDMRVNCAVQFHCGWWFSTCVRNANFNGRYYHGGYKDLEKHVRAPDDIYWPNIDQSLRKAVLKLQRNG